MAKETSIIFVYDTQLIQKEEDDPASAILYFHPTWVSDQQKTALCGQIMGTIQCLKNVFCLPKIVSLQNGKFYIIENGRYILALGTDRNIADWVLEHRANILYSLINFFHKDFVALSEIYRGETLSAKLYHIFETYLKMLFFGGSVFSNMPSLALPKSGSSVFSEAISVLQYCQELSCVLGGTVLYHNKVVATQLSSDLTKLIVLSDPYRIKCPAEKAETVFDLPLGVQLIQVYVTNKEYCNLLENVLRNRSIFQYLNNKSIKKPRTKVSSVQGTPIVSAMKRDQSLLFTAVPEEGDHLTNSENFIPKKKNRPKFLNLRSMSVESTDSKQIKTLPTTPFGGQTSVAATPMTELKRFIHQNPLTIINKDNLAEDCPEEKSEQQNNENNILESKPKSLGREYSSLTDISSIANNPDQYYKLKSKLDTGPSPTSRKNRHLKKTVTITDPLFPVFKSDGTIISHAGYKEYISAKLSETARDNLDANKLNNNNKPFEKVDMSLKIIENDISKQKNPQPTNISKQKRKSLTLPLKSLTESSDEQSMSRRYSQGVQLTPLMSKLSILAFEERSSGFCSRETTPSYEYKGLTPSQSNFSLNLKSNKEAKAKPEDDNVLQKCVLFVCGQQDVVLTLLMKEDCCTDKDNVMNLWEVCTEHLSKLEKQLNVCMESQSGSMALHETEQYSYLCLSSDWDTVSRGGPWGNDFGALNGLHKDFLEVPSMTEILLRNNDSVIYGYHCGPSEVYYHESANASNGLPPPSDPMGTVQLKARRRLERDHAIVLL